ncbi:hypothetical protein GO594_13135 [Pseudomonas otitidis]|jgi:hypothetical protein|uniref:Uncharacterized protein n=1 Tax=Metapseudomonas otitidis TaxID=319939 RepID=A0A7X3H9D9_9GAMM|nr:hypothetical protein [Pseudomonas otitidis]MWK56924.1 hypothetical protein [Pseudomonas otitidis]
MRHEEMTCAADMTVRLGDQEMTAFAWAAARGLKWGTVRQRRYRGSNWQEALTPGLRRSRFNDGALAGPR